MTWVVDASVAVAYLLGVASDEERRCMTAEGHAPTIIDVEVTQTLRGLARGAKLDLVTAELALTELRQVGVRRHPDVHLLPRCWELRDVCTTYDGLYVALAEALDATLVTRDARLARGIRGLVDVISP